MIFMTAEKIILHADRDVSLMAYIQDNSIEYAKLEKRPAIIVLPGGGYSMCSDREADCIAMAYLHAGFHCFVLRYTLKKFGGWPLPLNDYDEAVSLIKENKEKWHIDVDRIGVVGFSAGGHLAAVAATMAKNRPNVAILGYPALKKDIVDACQAGMPYPAEHVDGKTCPCFLFACRDDNIVTVDGMLDFQKSLFSQGVNFESHIYAYGGHGFATGYANINDANMSKHITDWVKDSVDFIGDVWGELTCNGHLDPKIARCVNGDTEEFLSVFCTYGHLLKNESAVKIIAPVIAAVDAYIAQMNGSVLLDTLTKSFKLCDLLTMFGLASKRNEMEHALSKIINK